MFIVETRVVAWFGLLMVLSFPILLIRDLVKAFKRRKLDAYTARVLQETDALLEKAAVEQQMEELRQEEEWLQQEMQRDQQILELEEAIEAASSLEEEEAAYERLISFLLEDPSPPCP